MLNWSILQIIVILCYLGITYYSIKSLKLSPRWLKYSLFINQWFLLGFLAVQRDRRIIIYASLSLVAWIVGHQSIAPQAISPLTYLFQPTLTPHLDHSWRALTRSYQSAKTSSDAYDLEQIAQYWAEYPDCQPPARILYQHLLATYNTLLGSEHAKTVAIKEQIIALTLTSSHKLALEPKALDSAKALENTLNSILSFRHERYGDDPETARALYYWGLYWLKQQQFTQAKAYLKAARTMLLDQIGEQARILIAIDLQYAVIDLQHQDWRAAQKHLASAIKRWTPDLDLRASFEQLRYLLKQLPKIPGRTDPGQLYQQLLAKIPKQPNIKPAAPNRNCALNTAENQTPKPDPMLNYQQIHTQRRHHQQQQFQQLAKDYQHYRLNPAPIHRP